MYVEKVNSRVNPVLPLFLRSDSAQLDQHKEAFREIFQQALNNRSNSRPPKIELRGVLVPCSETSHGRHFAEAFGSGTGLKDSYFDEYRYKEMIAQQGALEPAPDYLVS